MLMSPTGRPSAFSTWKRTRLATLVATDEMRVPYSTMMYRLMVISSPRFAVTTSTPWRGSRVRMFVKPSTTFLGAMPTTPYDCSTAWLARVAMAWGEISMRPREELSQVMAGSLVIGQDATVNAHMARATVARSLAASPATACGTDG